MVPYPFDIRLTIPSLMQWDAPVFNDWMDGTPVYFNGTHQRVIDRILIRCVIQARNDETQGMYTKSR